ncbi:MAG: hypothetical protein R2786_05250 [Flavobacteriaceae bacterium]
MRLSNILLFALSTIFIISCGKDENPNTDDSSTTLEEERLETTMQITGGDSKVWRIASASLTNESGTFDISNNFNVVDDEFVFSSEGTLEWRQGNDINVNATSQQETLLDYYRSSLNSSFNFKQDSSTEFTALNGRISLTVVNENSINGTITYDGRMLGGEITITLTPKLAEDYVSAPQNGLNFTELFTFESSGINGHAPGMIGSNSENSIYIVTREYQGYNGYIFPERIIKYNLGNSEVLENNFDNQDFVSKQLHIINNRLIVIGGQYINDYPLDFSSVPNSMFHGLEITRFGMSILDDKAYIIGGSLEFDPVTQTFINGEKVYSWNLNTQSLEYVTDLPEERYGARATIINNKLYVFGGMKTFFPLQPDPSNTIFIYDITSGTIDTEFMSQSFEQTFVNSNQNLTYIAGHKRVEDINGELIGWDFSFATYNTETGVYQEIPHNLANPNNIYNVWSMCIYNNKMYVIYGDITQENDPDNGIIPSWSVMVADLD